MRRIARKNENNKFIMIHNLRRAKNNENNKSQNHNSQFTDELMKKMWRESNKERQMPCQKIDWEIKKKY